jgi:hypothetical protein
MRGLVVFDTVALIVVALMHVNGVRIPLGSAVFDEPQIVPAAIVEGLAGVFFAVSAYAVFAGTRWSWPMTIFAHIFAIVGFIVGIAATSGGGAADTPFNYVYHRVMLAVFVIGLALLLLPGVRAAMNHDDRGTGGA